MKLLNKDIQEITEKRYSKEHIFERIYEEMESSEKLIQLIKTTAISLGIWLNQDFYPVKQNRLSQLNLLDMEDVVKEIFAVIIQLEHPEKLTSVVGMTASILNYSEKIDSIKTIAEIIAIMCHNNLLDIRRGEENIMYVHNRFRMSEGLKKFIRQTKYLPPMIAPPRKIKSNTDNGHYTFNDSLLLGRGTHHSKPLSYDILNTLNQTPLTLNVELLHQIEEMDFVKFDNSEKVQRYQHMIKEAYETYMYLIQHGNEFFLTHKPDKRGRFYSQGYHVNYQGSEYKKALVELANKEAVKDVDPKAFFEALS